MKDGRFEVGDKVRFIGNGARTVSVPSLAWDDGYVTVGSVGVVREDDGEDTFPYHVEFNGSQLLMDADELELVVEDAP